MNATKEFNGWETPEKIFSVFRHRKFIDKQEYICELQYIRNRWVLKIARLFASKGRFYEAGVFVFHESVFVGCFYWGRPVGYGVEFTKQRNEGLASFIVEADFSSTQTF